MFVHVCMGESAQNSSGLTHFHFTVCFLMLLRQKFKHVCILGEKKKLDENMSLYTKCDMYLYIMYLDIRTYIHVYTCYMYTFNCLNLMHQIHVQADVQPSLRRQQSAIKMTTTVLLLFLFCHYS